MTKFPLSGTTSPTNAWFAKDHETNELFCQAVEQRMLAAIVLGEM